MVQPTGSIRPLQFPLDRSADLESDTPNTPAITKETLEDWSTLDSDERINVVLNLSLNEYVALATAIDAGRDLAYGDNSIYIWWVWVRSIVSMALCDDILECIETSEAIQEAIANYSGGSNINSTTAENATNLAGEIVDNPAGCDNDIIFGMTVQLVEFADRLIKDLFEQIASAQLSSVNVGYVISLIPVVESLPLDEAFALTDKLVNDMETAYLSASTQLLKDEIACDLFCLAQDNNCVLTLEMVRDYFQEKANIVFSYTDVFTFLTDFINGTFVGNAVYYGMNILFFQIFAFGGKFLEYLFSDYLRVINSMYNDPNSDWSTICDDCPTDWTWTSDFANSENIWEVNPSSFGDRAVWTNGVGYEYADVQIQSSPNQYMRMAQIRTSVFSQPVEITKVEFTFDLTKGVSWVEPTTAQVLNQVQYDGGGSDTEFILNADAVNGNGQVLTLNPASNDAERLVVSVRSSLVDSANYQGLPVISQVKVYGNGFNPFV